MSVEARYQRNLGTLTAGDQERLGGLSLAVLGCGGLGGYVIEMLGRLGVGKILAVDGDVFDETNLNRQLLADTRVLGQAKATVAKARMEAVNPRIQVVAVRETLTEHNGLGLLIGQSAVVDAVDSTNTRLLLQKLCARLGIPLVHGAIAGWYGQVTTIFPGDRTLDLLYGRSGTRGIEQRLGNPSFTPALVAAVQVSEVVKLLLGRGELLRRRVLRIDLLSHEYTMIDLTDQKEE